MTYFTVLTKTGYSKTFIDQQQKEILRLLKKVPDLMNPKARTLNSNNSGTDLEIAIWPLNGQMINQEVKKYILASITSALGEQLILPIEFNNPSE